MKEEDAIALLIKYGCSGEVIEHCKAVAGYAKGIANNIKSCAEKKGMQINIDTDVVFTGGLLHDIGRSKTHGIRHAVAGAAIAIEEGLDSKLVNIIERHVGAGIPKEEAKALGLPEKDYLPVTLEEKIVAHADNLVFGRRVATLDEAVSNLRKKGLDEKILRRMVELSNELGAMMR